MKRLVVFLVLLASAPGLALPLPGWDEWQAGREAKAGNWPKATAMYEQIVKDHPHRARAFLNLGLCYYRQGQFDKAEELFKKARELDTGSGVKGQTSYDLGNTLYRKNKLEDALEAYKGALRWNDLDDDARYNAQVVIDKIKKNQKKDDKKKDDKKDKNKDKDKQKKDDKKDQNKDKNKDKDKKKDQNGQQPPPKPDQKNESGQQPNSPPPQDPSKMSKKDAEALLKYFQNREKQNLAKQMKKGRPAQPLGGDDW